MMNKLEKILLKTGLTLSRQSGLNRSARAAAILAALALPAAAAPIDWAHQSGAVQANGAVTVKTLSGGSYAATGNPGGAVARANQNAATQPPTVIIQATSFGYVEAKALVIGGSSIPSCPSGYNSIFTAKSSTFDGNPVFNIGGTRYTFSLFYIGGSNYAGFLLDGLPLPTVGVSSSGWSIGGSTWAGAGASWSANLCTK